jgi:tetratricopeptide (TPR) repeat protein
MGDTSEDFVRIPDQPLDKPIQPTPARNELAKEALARGDFESASKYTRGFLAWYLVETADAAALCGRLCSLQLKYEEAIAYFEQAIQFDPSNPEHPELLAKAKEDREWLEANRKK